MTRLYTSPAARRIALAGILIAMALVVVLSPAEQTLGQAVKVVYVHVAFTRAGEIGLLLAALLGLVVLATGSAPLSVWMQRLTLVGLGLYSAGFAVSLAAQALVWGGIDWHEPRVIAAMNVIVAAAAASETYLLRYIRLRGLAQALLGGFVLWELFKTPNVLHPGNAISSSPSLAIQATGVTLVAFSVLLGAWIVWALALRGIPRDSAPEGPPAD